MSVVPDGDSLVASSAASLAIIEAWHDAYESQHDDNLPAPSLTHFTARVKTLAVRGVKWLPADLSLDTDPVIEEGLACAAFIYDTARGEVKYTSGDPNLALFDASLVTDADLSTCQKAVKKVSKLLDRKMAHTRIINVYRVTVQGLANDLDALIQERSARTRPNA